MKKYENPLIEIFPLLECDTITASSGTEMPKVDGDAGIWDQNQDL